MVRRILSVKKKWSLNKNCSKRKKTLRSKTNKKNNTKNKKNNKKLNKNKIGGGWGRSLSRPIIIDVNQGGGGSWGKTPRILLRTPKVSKIKNYFTKHY